MKFKVGDKVVRIKHPLNEIIGVGDIGEVKHVVDGKYLVKWDKLTQLTGCFEVYIELHEIMYSPLMEALS